MRDKPSHYEGNFHPGIGYVMWKMAGFPKGGLSMGEQGDIGMIATCEIGKELFFQKGRERTCHKHKRVYAKKD